MEWKVNGISYQFDRDFRELSAQKRVNVVKMVRNLLKIQRENKSFVADTMTPNEREAE